MEPRARSFGARLGHESSSSGSAAQQRLKRLTHGTYRLDPLRILTGPVRGRLGGSAAAAADYLLADRDHAGKERAEATVLRGDPHQVAQVADSVGFEHRYRSAVIAWAPEDDPTNDQIDEAFDHFERVSWYGLGPDRYAWSAVLHRDDGGGAHVHVLAARVELLTGKSHNIAPPGWEGTYGLLEQALNHEHGWARPDDPDCARTTRPGRFPADAVDRDAIDGYLRQRVSAGLVHDRAGVVAAFEGAGFEVPR